MMQSFWSILFAILSLVWMTIAVCLFVLLRKKKQDFCDMAALAHDLSSACGIVRSAALLHQASAKDAYGDMLMSQSVYITGLCRMLCGVLQKEPFTVSKHLCKADLAVRDICTQLNGVLQHKNISLVFEAVGNCLVRVDEIALRRILHNLIVNASEAMEEGQITVTVNGRTDVLQISVQDNGRGMSETKMQRIFSTHETNKADRSIHGLGLPCALRLVKLHGGTMHVESTLGQGTCFSVRFPR